MNVGMTGARAGDLVRGVAGMSSGDTANVLLRIDTGEVAAPGIIRRTIEDELGRDAVVVAFAKHFGVSHSAATLRYADCPVDEEAANHRALGSGCNHSPDAESPCTCEPRAKFTILSQGVWQDFAEAHGNGAQLRAMVEEGRSVCWRDVLCLMQTAGQPGGKTLILRPRLFEVAVAPTAISDDDPRLSAAGAALIECVPPWDGTATHAGGHVYELDGHLARLPPAADAPFSKAGVVSVVVEAMNAEPRVLDADVTADEVGRLVEDALKHVTAGGLKSLMQKAVRLHARDVSISSAHTAPGPLVAATCAALLFADKGTFSPELQLFTRGGTAAFKRIAVILVEDSWPVGEVGGGASESSSPSTAAAVCALTTLAVAMQRIPAYHPPGSAVVAALRVVARAALAPTIVTWRSGDVGTSQLAVSATDKRALQHASTMLRIARSFECDMAMFEAVAKLGARGSLPVRTSSTRPAVMPLCHMVDQHCYRGVAHVMRGGGKSFSERFTTIFGCVTGVNPRRTDTSDFETRKDVRRVRFVQECVLPFVRQQPQMALPPPQCCAPDESLTTTVALQLDPGVLAAAVGPIKVKVKEGGGGGRKEREVLVMLGVRAPEDEICMLPPARATRDLFGTLIDSERAEAVATLRSRPSLPARSPLLAAGTHHVTYSEGSWRLDGQPWADFHSVELQVPLVEPPRWATKGTLDLTGSLLADDAALRDALSVTGDGCVPHAKQLVTTLFATAPPATALRAAAALRQQYSVVHMPTPSLSGGIGSDQLAAYAGDWDAYRLLVLFSRLVPGALRPTMPPKFHIPEPRLLRAAERWAMAGARLAGGSGEEQEEEVQAEVESPEEDAATLVAKLKEATAGPVAEADAIVALERLGRITMTTDSLRTSGAGRAVNDVKKMAGASERVRAATTQLVNKWKSVVAAEKAAAANGSGMSGTSHGGGSGPADGASAWANQTAWRECGRKAERRLMQHQRAAISRMHERDASADETGHFLILDTGMGKTVTSLVYAYRWLCKNGGAVKRLIWVTPAGTVDNLLAQLRRTWSAPVHLVPRISTAKSPKPGELSYPHLVDYAVNVIHADHLRTAIDKGLAELATSSFLIFDEVDEMYAPTLRTSAARALCSLCPKFVAQTATPMRRNESQLLAWLADTCAFPVSPANMLVAASGMVSIQLELGVSSREEELLVPMTDEVRQACRALFGQRQWLAMARAVQQATDAAMVDAAVKLAREDRAKHASGGVLLIADHLAHAETLIGACTAAGAVAAGFESLERTHAGRVAIVVVTKDKDRGYNSAVRLGHMVTGAYAGNSASRHQIRGRLRRLGQVREEVSFTTVVMRNSLLHLLHQRHSSVDSMNISLEQLGEKFGKEVLVGLDATTG